jgi:penicillin-binding protein 1A
VAIQEVKDKDGHVLDDNKITTKRVIPQGVVNTAIPILETVISEGTGKRAATGDSPEWGKTGTTEGNGDAWFVGSTKQITVAVWVGHADSTKSMSYDFGGGPVDGGTYPAEIWHDIILAYDNILAERGAARDARIASQQSTTTGTTSIPSIPAPSTAAPSAPVPGNTQQAAPAPAPSNPAPTGPPAPPPTGGGTGGAGGATGGAG